MRMSGESLVVIVFVGIVAGWLPRTASRYRYRFGNYLCSYRCHCAATDRQTYFRPTPVYLKIASWSPRPPIRPNAAISFRVAFYWLFCPGCSIACRLRIGVRRRAHESAREGLANSLGDGIFTRHAFRIVFGKPALQTKDGRGRSLWHKPSVLRCTVLVGRVLCTYCLFQ
jgi:hypothetical protein